MILHPLSIDYSQSGKLILTFEFNVGDGPSLTYVASDANILSFDGCEVADFDEPIVPFVACNYISGSIPGAEQITIVFDSGSLPDLDSAALTDFALAGGVNGNPGYTPDSIDYSVIGQITLTFPIAADVGQGTLTYTKGGLTFNAGDCAPDDFTWENTAPV